MNILEKKEEGEPYGAVAFESLALLLSLKRTVELRSASVAVT